MWQQCSSLLQGYPNLVRADIPRSFPFDLQIAAPFTRFILFRWGAYQLVSHNTKTTLASAYFSPTQEHLRQYEQESAHFHITMNYTHVLIVRLHHQVRQLYHRCVVSYCASAQIGQCYRFLSSRGYPICIYFGVYQFNSLRRISASDSKTSESNQFQYLLDTWQWRDPMWNYCIH